MLELDKYSIGTGDRFGKEASAQLSAVIEAKKKDVSLAIIWNKSHREHITIGTKPESVRVAADKAVKDLAWTDAYYVDADHINIDNVDLFIPSSDFFTLDVADFTGNPAPQADIDQFVNAHISWVGELTIPGVAKPLMITEEKLKIIAQNYLLAAMEAGNIYRHIEKVKGKGKFITEVSIDETDNPQTPEELLFILKALSDQGIPLQTVAPKFTGRFNKGVDYVGDLKVFDREFGEDLSVIAYAVEKFGLPKNLKLSVHSGSDKFSLYPIIRRQIRAHNAGLHIKTAGTTWLEEIIGLAEAGGEGLSCAKEIYGESLKRYEELTAPYATVIDIDKTLLPSPKDVSMWSSDDFTAALRHDLNNSSYNLHFRQLIHVGYKAAAEMGSRYMDLLDSCRSLVEKNVTENLLERHIRPLFMQK